MLGRVGVSRAPCARFDGTWSDGPSREGCHGRTTGSVSALFDRGVLIGLSATGLLLFNGKIAGISGIVGGLLTPLAARDRGWRIGFVGGLLVGGAVMAARAPELVAITVERSPAAV